jgi:hypothetical protein
VLDRESNPVPHHQWACRTNTVKYLPASACWAFCSSCRFPASRFLSGALPTVGVRVESLARLDLMKEIGAGENLGSPRRR